MKQVVFVDRNGVKLEVGMRVKVQHCIGRYGLTQTVIGRLKRMHEFGSVDVEPEGHMEPRKSGLPAGACMYPGFKPDEELARGPLYRGKVVVLRGYHEFHDVEHGHEKFIEALPEVDALQVAA
ncbi:hypothetical protein [Ottowia sp.]|uniref:hypothetical protein n=1 Tax=Ottowia sp. TaxID=1898956 RepID=UPI0025ECC6FA|nr:hypothetical protein [Ottowia sp.]MBK6616565.1 hypothetical protein [Ottowia sp.]